MRSTDERPPAGDRTLLFKGDDFALTDIEIVIEPIKERRLSEVVAAYGTATP